VDIQILYLLEKYFPYSGKLDYYPQLIERLRQPVWGHLPKRDKRRIQNVHRWDCENDIINKVSRKLYQ